ncbi:DUF2075 domain-containing protein [Oxalobacteraceae bacterium OM1]|nr:DUF2075 domain-containing protein [Oxalobacteraceae bacterium OM1]
MYEAYYGLTEKPFQANPDPSFFFGSRQHRRAMAYLDYGLHCSEGFIIVTGEVGAGKTTVVRNLLGKLNRDKILSAHLVSTQLEADDALRMVCAAFGLPAADGTKAGMLRALERFLLDAHKAGKRSLLIVDEAQNLSMQAVEELRMLSNFQADSRALLQTFLIGQPEFRQILRSPNMTQLRQRVIAACHIGPLDVEETQAYIEHRLKRAGWKDSPQFAPDVFQRIHQASNGVPRRINTICDRLLLSGFLAGSRSFTEADVTETSREIESETFSPNLPAAAPLQEAVQRIVPGVPAGLRAEAAALASEDVALRLEQVDKRLERIEAALEGLLRNNTGGLALLGRLVQAIEKDTAK